MSDSLRPIRRLGPALALACLLASCSTTINWNAPRTPSSALPHSEPTPIGSFFGEVAAKHPGSSGFQLVREGSDAFTARVTMADLAEKTLDAQYYIWEGDTTGYILADRLMRAADRGVRVRILLDDIYMTEERDSRIAALDLHPNVEIRVFNPAKYRGARAYSFFGDFDRMNHRMHNKMFVMDNAVGIVGGRNIGDIYFGVRRDFNYRDLEVLATGPVVPEMSASFDTFWNSKWAVPIGATVEKPPSAEDLAALRTRLEGAIHTAGYPYPVDERVENARVHLAEIRDRFIWAPGRVLVDDPSKVTADADAGVIALALREHLLEMTNELFVSTAYFVLLDPAFERIRQLLARGVEVRILTNSAATNDVVGAQAGYANNRKRLLEAGADLYELRPDSNLKRRWSVVAGKSKSSLHTKCMVFDRKSVFIGSFNLDNRSSAINTEFGVMIDSPEIAGEVAEFLDESIAPGSAFHVTLDAKKHLVWTAENDGVPVEYRKDPQTSFWHRFVIGFVRLLPIEKQL